MNLGQLIEQYRSDTSDTAKPYLWSDEECVRYANQAYIQFVRLTGGVADVSTSDVCEVPYSVGDQFVDLHKSILRIMRASVASDGRKLDVKNITDMDEVMGEADYGQTTTISLDTTGLVKYVVIGEQRHKARLVYVPDAADTLKLHVYRLPLNTLVNDSDEMTDVDEHHHDKLSLWMQHLGYNKHDADAFDARLSALRAQEFEAYCAGAKAEWERYKHKSRQVAYGGL